MIEVASLGIILPATISSLLLNLTPLTPAATLPIALISLEDVLTKNPFLVRMPISSSLQKQIEAISSPSDKFKALEPLPRFTWYSDNRLFLIIDFLVKKIICFGEFLLKPAIAQISSSPISSR